MMTTTVFSGPDDEVCMNDEFFQCIGSSTNYDSIYWTTSGSGYFDNQNIFDPQYVLSEDDKSEGQVLLSLNIIDVDGEPASDTMTLIVSALADSPVIPEGPLAVNPHETPNSEYFTEEVENAESYQWIVSPSEAGIISGEGTTGTVFWDSQFEGEAWIKVAAINSCGTGEFSDSLMVFVSETVGLTELDADFNLELMPNPSNGRFKLKISANNEQLVYISIVNYLGQILVDREAVTCKGTHLTSYDMGNADAGIYFVIVQNGKQRIVKKLVINE